VDPSIPILYSEILVSIYLFMVYLTALLMIPIIQGVLGGKVNILGGYSILLCVLFDYVILPAVLWPWSVFSL
jgi:hypothetical protein